MMYDSNEILRSTVQLADKVLSTGARLGGELAKAVLLTALEKVRETKENKVGITSLKNLLKSKEELGVIKINRNNLQAFKKQAKGLGITFASISNGNDVKIMYKVRQTNQVKECLEEMLEHEQANKLDAFQEKTVYDELNKHLDFRGINDGYYRHEIKEIDNEKSSELSNYFKSQGVENDIVVNSVNENNTFNILFRVKDKDREKLKELLKENKDLTIEEIKDKTKASGNRKESLEVQINKAEKIGKAKAEQKATEKEAKLLKSISKGAER